MIDWLGVITAPMRRWKYGEDGKYIHILIGIITVAFAVLLLGSFTKLSILSFIVGMIVEVIQKSRGGTNTLKESGQDAFWVWVGGTVLSYSLYTLGLINL